YLSQRENRSFPAGGRGAATDPAARGPGRTIAAGRYERDHRVRRSICAFAGAVQPDRERPEIFTCGKTGRAGTEGSRSKSHAPDCRSGAGYSGEGKGKDIR